MILNRGKTTMSLQLRSPYRLPHRFFSQKNKFKSSSETFFVIIRKLETLKILTGIQKAKKNYEKVREKRKEKNREKIDLPDWRYTD